MTTLLSFANRFEQASHTYAADNNIDLRVAITRKWRSDREADLT